MKYLQIYEEFKVNPREGTLYIFDFDDTLVEGPSFEKQSIELLKETVSIGSLLKKSVRFIGKTIKDLKWENGRIYVEDPDQQIPITGNWVRKKGRVYLVTPDKFYYTDMSLPTSAKKLSELYNSVENKAIVTGRIKTMKEKVEKSLEGFGLEQPNFGLFCYPSRQEAGDQVADWKAKTIVKLIKSTGFQKVKFYEDKSKWLRTVTNAVKKELPHIDWEGIKV